MPAIIRLSRHGKKGQAFYHIVVADKRFPRDARFIEKIGTYNPRTNPETVVLKFDRAIEWLHKGAKPSDTMRSIFSRQGVLFKSHLLKGVKKGVLTQEQADAKFAKWVSENEAKVSGKKSSSESSKRDAYKKRMATEQSARESRSAKRKAKEAASISAAETPVAAETPSSETTGEPKA
ncbi:MAG: 30S ribosomal protein S16 [Bacteroidetes bacterium]|nr:30S ribosomal protein S16 [Bacteroidota bacterium]